MKASELIAQCPRWTASINQPAVKVAADVRQALDLLTGSGVSIVDVPVDSAENTKLPI